MIKNSQLARAYFPYQKPKNASNQLRRWIRRCEPLLEDIVQMGYRPRLRYLSKRIVDRIYYHLGEP